MVEPGLDRHEWATRWAELPELAAAETLPELVRFVQQLLKERPPPLGPWPGGPRPGSDPGRGRFGHGEWNETAAIRARLTTLPLNRLGGLTLPAMAGVTPRTRPARTSEAAP